MAEEMEMVIPELQSGSVSGKTPETSGQDAGDELVDITETQKQFETDFALKLVETLIALNNDEISIFEAISRFVGKAEISCFTLFARSVPLNPIASVYPENGFLIFKGVSVPRSVNLTEKRLSEIEEKIMAGHDISNDSLHLLDLPPEMLNAFEMAVTIYNGKAEKVRTSYLAAVKNAKAQVIEVSAAVICVSIIITTALALLGS
jgi:hypothetical protein